MVCGREVPNGLKKMQLEALVEKDERESPRKRNDKRNRRGRGDTGFGAGRSASRGGGDPRTDHQETVGRNADSSSPSDSEHS